MEKKEYKKVHKKENKKNYLLMNISSIALIVSMIFSVVLILLGIFSTIKLGTFIILIVVDLLILVAGAVAEYISEKRFDKDYKNYKTENTVVARKIEVAPREEKKEEVKVEKAPKKKTTPKKNTSTKTATKQSSTSKSTSKKTTTKKTTKKA